MTFYNSPNNESINFRFNHKQTYLKQVSCVLKLLLQKVICIIITPIGLMTRKTTLHFCQKKTSLTSNKSYCIKMRCRVKFYILFTQILYICA